MDKKQGSERAREVAVELISGAAAALTYTDDEINDVFEPESAKEFIDLRNRVLESLGIDGSAKNGYAFAADSCSSMLAAEDVSGYTAASEG